MTSAATAVASTHVVGRSGRGVALERLRHRLSLAGAAVVAFASVAGWSPSPAVALGIVAAAASIGMPHGALDVVVGPAVIERRRFFAMYGALAGGTVAAWFVAPLLSLLVFFAASWVHFGMGDAAHHRALGAGRWALGAATAGCALGLPLVLHTPVVTPVLNDLLLGRTVLTAATIQLIGLAMVVPALAAGVLAVRCAAQRRRYEALAEIAAIVVVGVVAHPLVSFAVYFALWHSPRHLFDIEVPPAAWKATAVATVATLAAAAAAIVVVEPNAVQATRVIFIGLAALTTPHLMTTEALRMSREKFPTVGFSEGTSMPMTRALRGADVSV